MKSLGGKKRSVEQNKEYNRLRQQHRLKLKRLNMTKEQKEKVKEEKKIAMRKYREGKSKERKDTEKKKDKIAKQQTKKRMLTNNPLFGLAANLDTADFDENSNEFFKYLNIGCLYNQPTCTHCHAYRWPYPLESQNFCCKEGKILQSVQPIKTHLDHCVSYFKKNHFVKTSKNTTMH